MPNDLGKMLIFKNEQKRIKAKYFIKAAESRPSILKNY